MNWKEYKGLWISLAGHMLVLLLLVVGFEFAPREIVPHVPIVQAVAIDNSAENQKLREQKKQVQQQQREKERKRQEEIKRKAEAEKQRKEEARKKAEAEKKRLQEQARLKAKREAEAKKKAEAERKRQAEETARKKAAAEAKQREEQRKQQEAEQLRKAQQEEFRKLEELKRLEQLRAEQAERERQERLRQLDIDRAIYRQAISQHVMSQWNKPPSAQDNYTCDVVVTQNPAGYVLDVKVTACVGDAAFKQSVEQAVWKADPLPTPENPAVFDRVIRFNFEGKAR